MKCQKPFSKVGSTGWAHLLTCRECREHWQADRAIEAATARMRTVSRTAPMGLVDSMLAGGNYRPTKQSLWRPIVAAVAGLGAVAVVVAGYALHSLQSRSGLTNVAHRPSGTVDSPKIAGVQPERTVPRDVTVANRTGEPRRNSKAPTNDSAAADSNFLNPGRNGSAIAFGSEPVAESNVLPKMKDDFAVPSPVHLASNGSAETVAEMNAEAAARYAQEAKVVDERLFHNITLSAKHASFDEVCQELKRQTGVDLTAGRNVSDDNATIFVTAKPARDVMREISRVFGFVWERSGRESSYSYRLIQDKSAQIAEEKLRNDDVSKSLDVLSKAMQSGSSNLHGAGIQSLGGDLRDHKGVDVGQATFRNLSMEEMDILQSGRKLILGSPNLQGRNTKIHLDGALDPALVTQLLRSGGTKFEDGHWGEYGDASFSGLTTYEQLPGSGAGISLQLKVGELGGVALNGELLISATAPDGNRLGGAAQMSLGTVSGPAEEPLDNAKDNFKDKTSPGLGKTIELNPMPTTPIKDQGRDPGPLGPGTVAEQQGSYRTFPRLQPPRPFMTSDDFWQAVHLQTKRDVVADSFSRLFKLQKYSGSLFEVLSKGCDAEHYHWKLDEGFLTGRSEAYHWQRLNEVPKRYLVDWQTQRKATGWLPLHTVLAMAMMSDRQLDSTEVGRVVTNQWKLGEWGIPSRPHIPTANDRVRPLCRFLANLSGPQLEEALAGTLKVGDIPKDIAAMAPLEYVPADALMHVDYVPAGQYYWAPVFVQGKVPEAKDVIFAPTRSAVTEAARKQFPDRFGDEALYSDGLMGLRITNLGKSFNGDITHGDEWFNLSYGP